MVRRRQATDPGLLVEKFHLGPGDLDNIVIVQRVRLGIERLAVDHRKIRTFNVRDEIALRAAGDDRHLHSRLAKGGKRLGQQKFLADICAR